MNRKLYRSPDDRVLAGVAGGMAETYDIDPSLVRIGWALLIILTGGIFLVLYVVMALVVPLRSFSQPLWSASAGPDGAPSAPQMTPNTGGPPPPGYQPGYSRNRSNNNATGAMIFGLILILAGGYFLVRQFIPQLNLALLWPVVVIGLGAVLIVGAFVGRGSRQ